MIWFTAAAFVFAVLFLAAAWEPRTRPARPAFRQPLCPCPQGCGRPAGQHVEPYAARLLAALLLAATLRLTHPEARP